MAYGVTARMLKNASIPLNKAISAIEVEEDPVKREDLQKEFRNNFGTHFISSMEIGQAGGYLMHLFNKLDNSEDSTSFAAKLTIKALLFEVSGEGHYSQKTLINKDQYEMNSITKIIPFSKKLQMQI